MVCAAEAGEQKISVGSFERDLDVLFRYANKNCKNVVWKAIYLHLQNTSEIVLSANRPTCCSCLGPRTETEVQHFLTSCSLCSGNTFYNHLLHLPVLNHFK